jgi:PhnB protein
MLPVPERKEPVMAVKPIPDGYHTVTPYLMVEGASTVLEFAKQVFGAEEFVNMPAPNGKVGHAEIRIGDSVVMVADASTSDQGVVMPGVLTVYVDDVDKAYAASLEAGATSLREPADQFYGDRTAGVKDAAGDHWWISTHVEDVPPEEMGRRAQEWLSSQQQT